MQSREDYKQERLDRIMKLKDKNKDLNPSAPTMEELSAKPGYSEIKMRKLTQKDPN